jgi:hypothetical protein
MERYVLFVAFGAPEHNGPLHGFGLVDAISGVASRRK